MRTSGLVSYSYWGLWLVVIGTILLATLTYTQASEGDRHPLFRECVYTCVKQCTDANLTTTNSNQPILPINSALIVQPESLSLSQKLLFWTCPDDCKYRCMHAHQKYILASYGQTWKYYGKWPFIRILGMQEICSTLFSIANALPHLYFVFKYKHAVSSTYPLRSIWISFGLLGINSMLWSAVFHTRDTPVTEKLDYYSASIAIACTLYCTIIRVCRVYGSKQQLTLGLLFIALVTLHISYLHFIHFDYGWNMQVSIVAGILNVLLGYCWTWSIRKYWHAKLLAFTVTYLACAASMEIFDFPPILGVLDSHSIWHGLTPVYVIMFWKVLMYDAAIESQVHQSIYDKRTV